MRERMKNKPLLAVDVETADLSARYDVNCPIWCYSGYGSDLQFSYKWGSDSANYLKGLQEEYTFVFHQASFDVPVLRLRGVNVTDYHDTMCMSYSLYPENNREHSLETLAEIVNEKKLGKPKFDSYSVDMLTYCQQDSKITSLLATHFLDLLGDDEELFNYYLSVELPYIERIIEMQSGGVFIDKPTLITARDKYLAEAAEQLLELEIEVGLSPGKIIHYKSTVFSHYTNVTLKSGRPAMVPYEVGAQKKGDGVVYDRCELVPFNPGSTKQVAEALVKLYDCKFKKFTPSGQPKLDSTTLGELSVDYPLCDRILTYNKVSDFSSKFLSPLAEILGESSSIHANFNQFTTRTRRLSSSKPNLQNIPTRDERGNEIRKMFTAPPGYKLVCGDLDRIEVVILGWYLEVLFECSTYADAIRNREDVHSLNAKLWDVLRPLAKNGLFCYIYGGGANRLAETLKISLSAAKKILAAMERTLPELAEYRSLVQSMCRGNNGILSDWFGGRFVVPEILSTDRAIRAMGERQIGNYMIQGTAGSAFKILQIRAENHEELKTLDCRLALVVHDEAIYYAEESIAEHAAGLLTTVYSPPDLLEYNGKTLPIHAEFHVGDNWYTTKAA